MSNALSRHAHAGFLRYASGPLSDGDATGRSREGEGTALGRSARDGCSGVTRPLGAVETGGRRQQGEGREAVLSTCQGPATGNWEMITCLSIVGTVRTMCGRAGARGSRPPLLMNSVRAACEVGPTRHAGGVACRRVTVRGRSNSYSYSYRYAHGPSMNAEWRMHDA